MSDKGPLSFLFIIPIIDGRGSWPFPSQLKENLFQNSVRVRGLYSTKPFKDSFLFSISNASEHMACGKKVMTNVLGVFNFAKAKQFQLNGTSVTAPINVIPSHIKFVVTDENFKCVKSFEGWTWIEIVGVVKKHVE